MFSPNHLLHAFEWPLAVEDFDDPFVVAAVAASR
jgi:hypothetical protein